MAERLTPRTPDLDVRGSSLSRRDVSLDKELCSTLSLSTQVYKWVPARDHDVHNDLLWLLVPAIYC